MKKSTKSRLSLIISIAMLFTLVGCSEASDTSEERTSRSTREETEVSDTEKEDEEPEKTASEEEESEAMESEDEIEEEIEEDPIETTRPPLLPTETKETKETEKEPSETTKKATPTKKTTPGKKTTPTKAPTKKATPTKKANPTKKATPTKVPTKKPTATPAPAKLTQTMMQNLINALVEDMSENKFEAVNKRAGCEVMKDYGNKKDFLPLFYKNCTYTVSISNATATTCDIVIHFTYPEMGEAYEKAMAQPDKMKPVFWDYIEGVINDGTAKPVNVKILADEMEPFMSSVTKTTVDIKTKCTKKDKQYLLDGNIGALTMGFNPVFKWGGDGKLPENIALPIAEEILKAGIVQHQEYYDWYVSLYKGEFVDYTVSLPADSVITKIGSFTAYAYDTHRWTPGVPVKTNSIAFSYYFKEHRTEDLEFHYVYQCNGKKIYELDKHFDASCNSICIGIHKTDASKIYESGKYKVIVYQKSDLKNPICTIEFKIP